MNPLPLLIASVLATGVGQILFAVVVLWRHWYSLLVRTAVALLLTLSSSGAFWFVGAGLMGGEALMAALLFAGCQSLALWIVVAWRIREKLR
jgi:hypothetical protein